MEHRGSTALVTGASSGIGLAFVRALAARGADVALVARRADRLERLAAEIERDHSVRAHVLPIDLRRPGAARDLYDDLNGRGIRITTLVNNAGLGRSGELLSADLDDLRAQIAVNITALVELTHAFLPALVASGRGVLVNVASMAAVQPVPGMAVYAASKTFVERFTSAIAYELRERQVRVLTLVPGATRSEFWSGAGMIESGSRFATPEQVVATAMTALDRRRTPLRAVSGGINRVLYALASSIPVPERLALAFADRARAASDPA